jgi:hypothetical protein
MSTTLPVATRRTGITSVQLNNGLWRVTRTSGAVLGYVEQLAGGRFAAKRLAPSGRSFLPLGEFWTFDDAMDCLRFG